MAITTFSEDCLGNYAMDCALGSARLFSDYFLANRVEIKWKFKDISFGKLSENETSHTVFFLVFTSRWSGVRNCWYSLSSPRKKEIRKGRTSQATWNKNFSIMPELQRLDQSLRAQTTQSTNQNRRWQPREFFPRITNRIQVLYWQRCCHKLPPVFSKKKKTADKSQKKATVSPSYISERSITMYNATLSRKIYYLIKLFLTLQTFWLSSRLKLNALARLIIPHKRFAKDRRQTFVNLSGVSLLRS